MTSLEWQSRHGSLKDGAIPAPPWESLNYLATEPESVSTLKQIECWSDGFTGHWCFRGHRVESWYLISVLHRERKHVTVAVGDRIPTTYPPFDASTHQRSEFADFRHPDADLDKDSESDILARMQHYGVPTTSLDFSRSPYVASWFALEDPRSEKHNDGSPKSSALWGIDLEWLEEAREIMVRAGDPHVIEVQTVTKPNQRMIAQQGVLLVNRSPERTFSESLLGMLVKSPVAAKRQVVSKLIVKRDRRIELLEKLERVGIYRTSMLRPSPRDQKNAESTRDRMRKRTANEWKRFWESLKTRMESRPPR
jgi:hypothetical protein